ncbi:MAG TPA: glycoside hydrolase family 15 protein [Solirubrobacteraceae bacterium]|nr:glycoside hydrolase family 15 protein [Solirubrobacteraceae bacterium]
MALRIEDYALIGDTETAALVGVDGSMDWLCLPRFDAPACFAALLGGPEHGRWAIAPAGGVRAVRRRYRPATLVLETEWETDDGVVRVVDCMPPRDRIPDVLRLVEGVSGRVPMRMELIIRFDYGSVVPWVRHHEQYLEAVAGPDALRLRTPVELRGEDLTTVAEFGVQRGERVPFGLSWHASHEEPPPPRDPARSVEATQRWWEGWSSRCTYDGAYAEPVSQSLRALKAMTYHPTGGIVAAVTTSLPEQLGGVRNWDYRFCWLRDATFTLLSLLGAGYTEEAERWRDWLLRAVAGQPEAMQIMYGPAGERRLPELELPWLPGYEGSAPVRIGNGAAQQFQLDVYGELMDSLHDARDAGIDPEPASWRMQVELMEFLEGAWRREDEGIWEVRGARRDFVHSKVMAWVAFDRAVKAVERFGLDGPVDRWRGLRDQVHDEVCREGFDAGRRTFTQSYGSQQLDASLLMIPLVGFLPPDDPRVDGTVRAIERELVEDGFVLRYPTHVDVDGLPPGEGAFLPCSFWLVDCLALGGRRSDALELYDRLLALRNDVGLLSEEYDPHAKRLVGNFPQAFTHVGLVNSALNLDRVVGPADRRRRA